MLEGLSGGQFGEIKEYQGRGTGVKLCTGCLAVFGPNPTNDRGCWSAGWINDCKITGTNPQIREQLR